MFCKAPPGALYITIYAFTGHTRYVKKSLIFVHSFTTVVLNLKQQQIDNCNFSTQNCPYMYSSLNAAPTDDKEYIVFRFPMRGQILKSEMILCRIEKTISVAVFGKEHFLSSALLMASKWVLLVRRRKRGRQFGITNFTFPPTE